jgi:hypothetical protein
LPDEDEIIKAEFKNINILVENEETFKHGENLVKCPVEKYILRRVRKPFSASPLSIRATS